MNASRSVHPFRKVLVPVIYGCAPTASIAAAKLIAGEGVVVLAGLVRVPPDESLSVGALAARHVRKTLRALVEGVWVRSRARVRVSHSPWAELVGVAREEMPDLLVLEWPCSFEALGLGLERLLFL